MYYDCVCVIFVYILKNVDVAHDDYDDVYDLRLFTLLLNIALSSNVVHSVTFTVSYQLII